jgi:hypothetical protein
MNARTLAMEDGANRYESDFGQERNSAENLDFSQLPLGQSCPQHCPYQAEAVPTVPSVSQLGESLSIDEVAKLLGCSPWTVRQRYLRQGLPYLQARPRGKLVFFREQVVAWIEKRQRQKGGIYR